MLSIEISSVKKCCAPQGDSIKAFTDRYLGMLFILHTLKIKLTQNVFYEFVNIVNIKY